jgi:diguanylate cyclase (GGDEF)-like protein
MKMGRGFAGRAALTGKPIVLGSKSNDIRFDPSILKKMGFQSLCCVPIIAREKILGAICVGSRNSSYFPESETRLLRSIATQIGVAVENVQLYEEAVETAITDSLTGLYNRRYFMEEIRRELARAERNNTTLSVIMSDLDGLKPVNDRFGHDQGDLLIKTWSTIMSENVRVSDVVARLGGDEFVLLAPETDPLEAHELSQRLLSAANTCQIQIDGGIMSISVSIGLASYPAHASDAEEILRKVDEAMYHAKRTGKNRICIADPVNAPSVQVTLT